MAYGFNDDKSKAEVYTKEENIQLKVMVIYPTSVVYSSSTGNVTFKFPWPEEITSPASIISVNDHFLTANINGGGIRATFKVAGISKNLDDTMSVYAFLSYPIKQTISSVDSLGSSSRLIIFY